MGRPLFTKRAFEEVNKAEDEEASTRSELLGTMEVDQAETFVDDGELPKENIVHFPEIDWDALRLDLDDDEDWDALQASLAQQREREREETREPERKETAREQWLRIEELEKRMAEEQEAQEREDQEEIGRDYLVSVWEGGKYRDDWNAIWVPLLWII